MLRLTLILMALTQLPPSPDATPVPVRGVVVDDSMRPVAGADVWLADAMPSDEGRRFGVQLWWSSLSGPGEGVPPVLIAGRTDAAGAFSLELPAEAASRRSPPALAVWAANGREKGLRVAFRRLPRIVLPDDPPLRIELGSPTHAELTVLAPGREPAAGARIIPTRAGEVLIPEPLGRLLAAETDARGRAAVLGLDISALGQLRIESAGFGVQTLELPGSRSKVLDAETPGKDRATTSITLAPVGRIRGQLTTPHGELIRGVAVRATSQVGGYAGMGQGGAAEASCDEQGRFDIPAIAAGMAELELAFDRAKDFPLRGEARRRLVVKAGQTSEVTVALRETVTVRGLVREKGTNRPVAGAKVLLNGHYGGDRYAITDAEGRFAGRILRGTTQPYGWLARSPSPLFEPDDMGEPPQRMPKPGTDELEQPPVELRRGAEVRGTVAGEDGRPVAGAGVEAIWHDSRGLDQSALARTDQAGSFVLHGISPTAELDLNAWDRFAATSMVTVRAATAAQRPITLTLSPKDAVSIGGRVVDAESRPVAGAAVRIRRQLKARDGRSILDEPVSAGDGTVSLHTGADGRYRAHGRFPARADYYAEATAPGRLAARSTPVPAGRASDGPTVLVLRRVRTVEGRVIDRRGQPVAGITVRQSGDGPMPTEAITAADGRFQLPGVIEGPALIFAEGAGFHPRLLTVADISKPVELTLERRDEPTATTHRTLPPAQPADEEKALAHRVLEPLAAKILASTDDVAKYRFLIDAAEADPQAAIEWLDEVKFGGAVYRDWPQIVLASALARENLDDATAVLEAGSPYSRAYGYTELVETVPTLAADRKRPLLEQAILNSKTVTPLSYRFVVTGRIAERLIEQGDTDRARKILEEAQELARSVPPGDKDARLSSASLAVPLAQIELPAALKIVEDLEQDARKNEPGDRSRIYDRFYGRIAYVLAARSPAEAEKVLGRTTVQPTGDRAIVAICTRMAPADFTRARRIVADRISPGASALRPDTLGLMAQAVAAKDRPAAARLLDEAFDELERLAAVEPERGEPRVAVAATALLPAVESVDPGRMTHFIGRALLMRRPRGDQAGLGENAVAHTAARLAMMTARYDRALAAHILGPELTRLGSHKASFGRDYITPDILAALALIDPRRAVAMVEALPEDPAPGTDPVATKGLAGRQIARVLAQHGDARWRMIVEQFLYLWSPGQKVL